MKRIAFNKTAIALFAAAVMLGGSGCKKWVDVEPKSEFSIEETFSNLANANYAVLGAYDELAGDDGYGTRLPHHFANDNDETMTSGNLDNGRRGLGRYDLKDGNSELNGPFRQLYRGVEKANLCIEQIPLMKGYNSGTATEQAEARRLYGEALVLRAQFLFEIIRTWGDAPAPFVPSYQQKDAFIPKANRDTVYERLISDLAVAKELLPWKNVGTAINERVTKGAAMALRARLALYRGGYSLRKESNRMERRGDYLKYYQIAKDECAELIKPENRKYHTLNPSFENVFRNIHAGLLDPYGEIIFEVGMKGDNATSDSKLGRYDGPRTDAASRYGTAGGGINVVPTYFYAFDSIDTRRDVTITLYSIDKSNIKNPQRLTGITNGKFRRDWRVPLLPGEGQYLGYNWPIIRFSDVLLMYAEADNELSNGPTASAIAAFEEVRKRGFKGNETRIGATPTDKEGFFNAIVKERSLEFGSEAIRKHDLIRWNLLDAKLKETRANLVKLRDGVAPYDKVPTAMYYKNNGEELEWYNKSFQNVPSSTPTGWKAVDWRKNVADAKIDNLPFVQSPGRLFTPNKNELYPFPLTVTQAYSGKLTQDYGY